MIDFIVDNLLLLPFLFVTYLVLEAMEARVGDALERKLGRVRHWGPFFGSVAGAIPQCGFSAAAASLYAGGIITAGTLVAVFLSTSDELIPVLISAKNVPAALMFKIVGIKVAVALLVGVTINAVMHLFHRPDPKPHVDELCAHSHCGCTEHRGIVVPALIHTCEIFVFILIISGIFEYLVYLVGEESLRQCFLHVPFVGEMIAGLIGFIPNCAISVIGAELYVKGGMSAGALMASSFTGCGVGLAVLFRTNRNWVQNLSLLGVIYVLGVVFGYLAGFLLPAVA